MRAPCSRAHVRRVAGRRGAPLSSPWLRLGAAATLLAATLCACSAGPSSGTSAASSSGGLLVLTAGGTALVDGQSDVPPTLDLRLSASHPLAPSAVQGLLDGAPLPLDQAPGGALTAAVRPMPLGSAHRLQLDVAGRGTERLGFSVIPPTGAYAAVHADAAGGVALDLTLQYAADHHAIEAGLPPGARASWPDRRHLRATWPAAPGGALQLPSSLPTSRGSHLAGDLRLDLSPLPAGALRSAVVPAAAPPSAPPLVVAFTVGTPRSRASLAAHWSQISLASPTGLRVEAGGRVGGTPDQPAVDIARAHGLPVWPLLQNDASDSQGIATLLEDDGAVHALVAATRRLLAEGDFPGLHLDIEGVPEGDRDRLTALVVDLADALHADGRRLAVAVVPHKPEHLNVYSAAYDLPAIAAHADLVTLMAYDEHTSLTDPGAVAGLTWDREILSGSLSELHDPGSVVLGLPLYARTWNADGSVVADSYSASVQGALSSGGARVDYDFGAATPYVRSGDGATQTWFDDAASLGAKLALVSPAHLRGVALWRLGFEDPAVWGLLPATPARI